MPVPESETAMRESRKDGIEGFLAAFGESPRAGEPSWLGAFRESSLAQFAEAGIPRVQEEEWKYTNLRNLKNKTFEVPQPQAPGESPAGLIDIGTAGDDIYALVFLNGIYSADLSSPPGQESGVAVLDLASAIESRPAELESLLGKNASAGFQVFSSLNNALFTQGAYVHVSSQASLDKPLHLLYLATGIDAPFMVHPRNLFRIDEGGKIDIVEDYSGACETEYFCNPVTEIFAAKDSAVGFYKVVREGAAATHVSNLGVLQEGQSSFTASTYCLGGKTIRNDVVAQLDGENIECTLNGLAVGSEDQHIDNHTRIIHAKPNCNSWEVYKSILADRSHGVFNGKIFVAQDAQKTDAKQTNQSLLLSESAVMDSKPELEIYADDVKCTHGATVGQLDEEGMFYLRSRGIPEKRARDLLVFAFASDLVTGVAIPSLKTRIEAALFDKLPGNAEPSSN